MSTQVGHDSNHDALLRIHHGDTELLALPEGSGLRYYERAPDGGSLISNGQAYIPLERSTNPDARDLASAYDQAYAVANGGPATLSAPDQADAAHTVRQRHAEDAAERLRQAGDSAQQRVDDLVNQNQRLRDHMESEQNYLGFYSGEQREAV